MPAARARTRRVARPRPRAAGSVQTALISVAPGTRRRSPAMATSPARSSWIAEVGAELVGAPGERARLGAPDEREHGVDVGVAQDVEAVVGRGGCVLVEDHLDAGQLARDLPSGRQVERRDGAHDDDPARSGELDGVVPLGGVARRREERRDVGVVAHGTAVADRERARAARRARRARARRARWWWVRSPGALPVVVWSTGAATYRPGGEPRPSSQRRDTSRITSPP